MVSGLGLTAMLGASSRQAARESFGTTGNLTDTSRSGQRHGNPADASGPSGNRQHRTDVVPIGRHGAGGGS